MEDIDKDEIKLLRKETGDVTMNEGRPKRT